MRDGDRFFSEVLTTISDRLKAQRKTNRIDTKSVAGIFVKRMARIYVEYIRC